jgi:HK97 gp10 family phage protein
MTVKISISGLDEIQAALEELSKATGRNVLKRALLKAAEPIVADARSYAPVASGALRDSITVGTRLTKRQKRLHRKAAKTDVEVFVGPGPARNSDQPPQYAHLVEFGSIHNDPHAFMRPAWDKAKTNVIDRVADDLWAEVKRAAERQAKKAKG